MDDRFRVGQHILYRGPHVDDSGAMGGPIICDVKPVIVVEDSPELIALFLPAGTPTFGSFPVVPGTPKPWGPGQWELRRSSWDRWNTLYLQVPGEWRSTWVMWSPAWEFLGWYVNLQEPLWRTRWGFDIRDLQLDILVAADGSWRWKDADDFARSIDCGLICAEFAEETRRSADAAVRAIEAKAWPFDETYRDWRPQPSWGAPPMPEGDEFEALMKWSAGDAIERCE